MDLIDRKDAIDAIRSLLIDGDEYREYNHGLYAAKTILSCVLPAEKTGKWLTTWHKDEVVCSNCRKYWVLATDIYDYKYCPNCGARMVNENE